MSQFANNHRTAGPGFSSVIRRFLISWIVIPIIGRLEQDMFEAVLRTKVRRQMMRNSGLYECAFHFGA